MFKKIKLFLLSVLLASCLAFYGESCPVCDMSAYWTGETKYEWGHTFYEYKCVANHYFWVRRF